ncbi:MAG: N-acetylmuramic acid 6-phosphate etherase, partial [Bacteroidota bacterium]
MNDTRRELADLLTEKRNPATFGLDGWSTLQVLKAINAEDKLVAHAVEREIPYIEKAVELVVAALRSGGTLTYVGAGTSGRLGILDAAECPPTFGTDPARIQGVIAGGPEAV